MYIYIYAWFPFKELCVAATFAPSSVAARGILDPGFSRLELPPLAREGESHWSALISSSLHFCLWFSGTGIPEKEEAPFSLFQMSVPLR